MVRKSSKNKAYRFGLFAEIYAALYMICHGYRILSWRFKTSVGEVDLIAARKNRLVFIEVKARRELSTALESVTPQMKRRISAAAKSFVMRYPRYQAYEMRFDFIGVVSIFKLVHLDNAWALPS